MPITFFATLFVQWNKRIWVTFSPGFTWYPPKRSKKEHQVPFIPNKDKCCTANHLNVVLRYFIYTRDTSVGGGGVVVLVGAWWGWRGVASWPKKVHPSLVYLSRVAHAVVS